jgi:tRNA dimethylallyltransferase
LGDSSRPVIRVICGPTAAGKTAAAMSLARLADIAVVSADSRQIYRAFDVGTAKPTAQERRAIPHYGIDVLEPTERASAAWWAEQADAWIRDAMARGLTPVVVGGTGLYLKALFGALFDEPHMDAVKRRELQAELAASDTETLRRSVAQLDPSRAHLGRTQLLRAIEIALLTGRRVSELHRERHTTPRWSAHYLVVDPGQRLAEHIVSRTRGMFERGWRDEVRSLMRSVPQDAPAWNASGYGTIRELEQGGGGGEGALTEEDALERVVIETRQYAKRQRTWFRHQLAGEHVTRLDLHEPGSWDRMEAWWNGRSGGEEA